MDQDGWATLGPYLAAKDVNYPVGIGNDATADAYSMYSMPMTFLIDRDGQTSAASSGVISHDECEKEIVRLLGS